MELTSIHYIYIFFVILIFITLLLKKDIVIPCIIGIFAIGLSYSGNVIFAIQTIYNTLLYAGNEFWGVIVIISLVMAMSQSLSEIGADQIMISPIKRVMKRETHAFFVIGFLMMIVSWLIWPSPSVALIGAILLPAAISSGIPAVWAAVAMNLFGHGIALSSDFFIQGAPTITGKAANSTVTSVMSASLPLWATMSVVTVLVAFFMFKRDMKLHKQSHSDLLKHQFIKTQEPKSPRKNAKFIAILTPLVYLIDIILIWKYQLTGGNATALVGGSSLLLILIITLTGFRISESLEKVVDYLKYGFGFGIKVFAPVIVIGGFFFLGNETIAQNILGENARGLLNDISMYLSQAVGVSKPSAIIAQVFVAVTTGLDGSGFSGLPIVGTLAYTFGSVVSISIEGLAALGQIITVWVGGGTIIPWAVIPVAAICKVSPAELVRKNFIPVLCGIAATTVLAFFIL